MTIIDDVPRLGAGLTVVRRMRMLAEHGLQLVAGATDMRIEPTQVVYCDTEGIRRAVPADSVIVAKGAAGDLSLAHQLSADGFIVHEVGDCGGVGYIEGAMRGAARAAERIS